MGPPDACASPARTERASSASSAAVPGRRSRSNACTRSRIETVRSGSADPKACRGDHRLDQGDRRQATKSTPSGGTRRRSGSAVRDNFTRGDLDASVRSCVPSSRPTRRLGARRRACGSSASLQEGTCHDDLTRWTWLAARHARVSLSVSPLVPLITSAWESSASSRSGRRRSADRWARPKPTGGSQLLPHERPQWRQGR